MSGIRQELQFLAKHSVIYGTGHVLSRAVAFLLLPLYTRYLTPTDYGVLELIDTTSGLLGVAVGINLTSALGRFFYDMDDHGRRRLLATVYALVGAIACVAFLPAMLVSEWLAIVVLDGAEYARYFQVAFAGLLLGLFVDIGQGYLRIKYRSTSYIAISITSLALSVALNVLFIVWFELGVLGVLLGTLLTRVIIGVPLTGLILWRTGFRPSLGIARAMIAYSAPLVPSSFARVSVSYVDRYLLKHFASIADTGIYGLARKISSSLHMLITSPFIMTFLPRRFQIAQRPDAPRVFRRVFDVYLLGLIVPATLLAIFTPEIMKLMTTPAYYAAGALVPVLLLEMIVLGSKYHVEFGILHAKQTKYYFYVNTIASVAHVVLATGLVFWLGMWGAVLAGLTSTSLQTGLLYLAGRRFYYIPFDFQRAAKALAVAAFVVVVAQSLPEDMLVVVLGVKLALSAGLVLALMQVHAIGRADLMRLGTRLRGASAVGS